MKTRAVLLALLLIGCAGPDSAGSPTELDEGTEDEVGATRASRESVAVEQTPSAAVAPSPASASVVAPRPPIVARAVRASEGENGQGEVIAAVSPIAFDLDARAFPVRALDPVLHVGELHFIHYTYPAPGILRFIAADRGALSDGAEAAVQYGDDVSSRRVASPALELP